MSPNDCIGEPFGDDTLSVTASVDCVVFRSGKELPQEQVVQVVAGLVRLHPAQHPVATGVKVADEIEDLVIHQLLPVAQPVGIHHPVRIYHHRIVQRATFGQTHLPDRLDLLHHGKGPGIDNGKSVLHVQHPSLLPSHRITELDGHGDVEGVLRFHPDKRVVVRDLHGFEHLEAGPGLGELVDPDPPHFLVELPGRTVHDRNLGAVDIDEAVGDPGKVEGRHEVLDGGDCGSSSGDQGGEPGICNLVVPGRDNLPLADEGDAVLLAGNEFEIDLTSGVEADSLHFEDPVDGRLMCFHSDELLQISPASSRRQTQSAISHFFLLCGIR